MMWRRLADWCVPASAMNWGKLTGSGYVQTFTFDAQGTVVEQGWEHAQDWLARGR